MRRAILLTLALTGSNAFAQVLYDVVDLTEGANETFTRARGVNNSPRVTGWSELGGEVEKGLMWKDGQVLFELLALPKDFSTGGFGLNSNDIVAGYSEEVIDMNGEPYADTKAVVWQGGVPLNVDDIVGFDPVLDPRIAFDINDQMSIIGPARIIQDPDDLRGFAVILGELFELGALTRPQAINNNDVIVGYALGDVEVAHAWEDEVATSLDHPSIEGESRAYDINDAGCIVGEAAFADGVLVPAIWEGVPQPLVDAASVGSARSVNAGGDIVGWLGGEDDRAGFVRVGASVRPLLDVIAQDQGWERLVPYSINDLGHIVGDGVRDGKEGHAFMLVPRCAADFNGDDALSILDFVAFQEAFVAGHPGADMNADGVHNILDFVTFQLVFVEGCG